jgi:high-affinity iron transporter
MIPALLVALREGVEAALIVGIVLVYLDRSGRRALKSYAWGGVILACAASVAAAVLLQRWAISEDGFEGLLMLLASALVVTMIIWMNRVARSLRKTIEARVETYAQRSTTAAGWGIGAFVFFMVVRGRGTRADPASGGAFDRGHTSVDWDAARDCDCRRRGRPFLSGNAADSAASLF